MLPPFRIRLLWAADDSKASDCSNERISPDERMEDGIVVHLEETHYDDIVSANPSAALKYMDDDDGEIVTVGTALELSQRLAEPAPRIPMISNPPSSEDSIALHTFEVDQAPDILQKWRSEASPWSTKRGSAPGSNSSKFQDWYTEREDGYAEPGRTWPPRQGAQGQDVPSEESSQFLGDRSLFSLDPESSSQAAFQNEKTRQFKASDPPHDLGWAGSHTSEASHSHKDENRSEPELDELARETTPLLKIDAFPARSSLSCSTSLTSEGIRQVRYAATTDIHLSLSCVQAKEAGFKIRSNMRPTHPCQGSATAKPDRKEHQNRWASYGRTKSPFSGDSANYTSALSTSLTAEGIRQAREAGARIRSSRSPPFTTRATADGKIETEEHQSRWASYGRTESPFGGDPTEFISELSKNVASAVKTNAATTEDVMEHNNISERENPFSESTNPDIEVEHISTSSAKKSPEPCVKKTEDCEIISPKSNSDGPSRRPLLEIFEAELAKLVEPTPPRSSAPVSASHEQQVRGASMPLAPERGFTEPASAPSPVPAAPTPQQHDATPAELFASGLKSMMDGLGLLASQVQANLPETQQRIFQMQRELPDTLEQVVRGTIEEVGSHIQQAASTIQSSTMTPDAAADQIGRAERQFIDGAIGGFKGAALEAAEFGKSVLSSFSAPTQQSPGRRQDAAVGSSDASLHDAFMNFLASASEPQGSESNARSSAATNLPEPAQREPVARSEPNTSAATPKKEACSRPLEQSVQDKVKPPVESAANRSERLANPASVRLASAPCFANGLREDKFPPAMGKPERHSTTPAKNAKDGQMGSIKPASNVDDNVVVPDTKRAHKEDHASDPSRLDRENHDRRFEHDLGFSPRHSGDFNRDPHRVPSDRHYNKKSSPEPSPRLAYEYVDPRNFVSDSLYDDLKSQSNPVGPREESFRRRSASPLVDGRQPPAWPRLPKHGPIHLSEESAPFRIGSRDDYLSSFWRPPPVPTNSKREGHFHAALPPFARPHHVDFPAPPTESPSFTRGLSRPLHHRQSWHPASQNQWTPRSFSPQPFASLVEKETSRPQRPQAEPIKPSRLRHHRSTVDPLMRRSEALDLSRPFKSEDPNPRRKLSTNPLPPRSDAIWDDQLGPRPASFSNTAESKDSRSLICENGSDYPADDTDTEDAEATHIKPPWGYERLEEGIEPSHTESISNPDKGDGDHRHGIDARKVSSTGLGSSTFFEDIPRASRAAGKAKAFRDNDSPISEMSRFPSLSQFENGSFNDSKPFPALPSMEPLTPQNVQESVPSRNPFSTPRQRVAHPFSARIGSPLPGSRLAGPFDPLADAESRLEQEESLYDSFVRTVEHPPAKPSSRRRTREADIDYCVQQLLLMGYKSNEDRLFVYAQAVDGNVEEAIQMIEDERKAYQSRGVLTL
ncbi:MAG: hypothetical protein M1819_000543 [Sarea resinae]|nr:MAG: hypothetical protein M1819_000543 [Sarea resinae]